MKMTVRRAVAQLQPGDVLSPTGRTIVSVSRGLRTKSGHHDVMLCDKSGASRRFEWRSATVVSILKKATT